MCECSHKVYDTGVYKFDWERNHLFTSIEGGKNAKHKTSEKLHATSETPRTVKAPKERVHQAQKESGEMRIGTPH